MDMGFVINGNPRILGVDQKANIGTAHNHAIGTLSLWANENVQIDSFTFDGGNIFAQIVKNYVINHVLFRGIWHNWIKAIVAQNI